jgi:ASC-1-like (ASCH) protein
MANEQTFYKEHLSEPWVSLVSVGAKTVEGRKNKGRFKDMKVGDLVIWENSDFSQKRTVITKIIKKVEYRTFREYLEREGLNKCLPSIYRIEQGIDMYYNYYTKEEEEAYGVVAIHIETICKY